MQVSRSLSSIQSQSSALAKYEQQLNSNLRYQYGSDAPFDSATTLAVQMQMERREQNSKNTESALSFLSATESSVSKINTLLSDARGAALDAINTTTSASQRASLAMTVQQTILQVFNLGNTKYNDRYLFAGATTDVLPLNWGKDSYTIDYLGSIQNLKTWTNDNLLAQSNVNGVDIFGTISEPVHGRSDLRPALRYETPLRELNGGEGVQLGSIRLSFAHDGVATVTDVDLKGCVTVRDVCERIMKASPPGIPLQAERTNDGIAISLPKDVPVSMTITEVGRETVARQLGIYAPTPIPSGSTFVGSDLNAVVSPQTPLADLFGARALASLRFAGSNNDIIIEAEQNGDSMNGIEISLFGDRNIPPGQEVVTFDAATNRVTIAMHPDLTSANDLVAAIDRAHDAGKIPALTARLDPLDYDRSVNNHPGTGLIPILPGTAILVGSTKYGIGENFDQDSGMQIVNGNRTHTLDFSACRTVGDFLSVLNDPQYGLTASINSAKTGIDIKSRVSGADFMIGENGGVTATQLGVRSLLGSTALTDLDFGRGVHDYEGPGVNASAIHSSQSPNSEFRIMALAEGPKWNGVTVNVVATTDPEGQVLVTWDETAAKITIAINPGVTRACDVIAAFNEQPGAREFFRIELEIGDGINTGYGVIDVGTDVLSGGTDGGIDFIITRNDGTNMEININGAKTLDEVLRIINEHPKNQDGLLVASLSKFGNGIELIDRSIGGFTTRVDRSLLSTAAIELGLVEEGKESREKTTSGSSAHQTLSTPNWNSAIYVSAQAGSYANGVRVEYVDMNAPGGSGNPSFMWDAANNVLRFEINPGTTTANDVLQLFKTEASPQIQSLYRFQNGFNPDGTTSSGTGLVTVNAWALNGGSDSVLTGRDPNPLETESLYTALIRLQQGMEKNDIREIERATQVLDKRMDILTNVRAEVGVRQQALDTNVNRLDDEYVQFRATLKTSHEIDFAATSINYMGAQTTYAAALAVSGNMFKMSLLDYL